MFLGFVVLFTALTISSVAIFYSVAGLVAIFAAAALPIAIMGVALEVAKLVTTVWLHKYWDQSVWWLKTYLSISVVVLMLITSMGIFGYLSKAHIEQTAQAEQGIQEIERITDQITEYEADLASLKSETESIKNSGSTRDQEIQSQIDLEQQRIDSAYTRIQPAIDEQNDIISKEETRLGGSVTLYQEQVNTIDTNLKSIEENIASGNIETVQAIVGVEADGELGPATERAIEAFRSSQTAERQRLTTLIATESKNITSPVIDSARAEIQRLRGLAEQEIAKSNELINRLRSQIGTSNTAEIDQQVKENNDKINKLNERISELSDQKFKLETEYRKLEAEVGPIKYIAEFIYGESADKSLLEEAVRWVIVMIIFVFDPLAVLLLIASQYTFNLHKKAKVLPELVSNEKTKNELPKTNSTKKTRKRVDKTQGRVETLAESREAEDSKLDRSDETPTTDLTPEERHAILEETEKLDSWKAAKKIWKEQNPDLNLKAFKDDFLKGKIDSLPWEPFVDNPGYVQNSEQTQERTLWSRIRDRNGSNNSNNTPGQAT